MGYNDGNLIQKAYVNNQNNGDADYNYELSPLIQNFSFFDFVEKGQRKEDNGGFVVITNNQYIIGYNAGFGAGTHISAFARTMKDLNGGGVISNGLEAIKLSNACKLEYIIAQIVYEYQYDNEYSRPIYGGCINFELSNKRFTINQYNVFKKFYEDYNNEIKLLINKYGRNNFYVRFSYIDEFKKIQSDYSDSFDNIFKYIENHIDETKKVEEDKIILGKEVKTSRQK